MVSEINDCGGSFRVLNPYRLIADKCRLSERTIRTAFSRGAVNMNTAQKIAKACGIPIEGFRIKVDNRGRPSSRG